MNITNLLNKLLQKEDLNKEDIDFLFEEIAKGNQNLIQLGGLLIALRMKEESVDEIVLFIQAMRQHMIKVFLGEDIVDTCGTGGDGIGTFNISTAVAFVLSGCGVKIVKHGSAAVSGKCGSADVLSELGVRIMLTSQQAEEVFQKTGIVFLFAPLFHPVMKNISGVRKDLGVRTIFNLLGPFINPASAKRQLIGVADKKLAAKLARVAAKLDYTHVVIFSSDDGMDEISISSRTAIFDIRNGKISKKDIDPEMFGIKRVRQNEILGGDIQENAAIIRDILSGNKGPKRDIIVLNSAVGLYVAGRVSDIHEGIKLAEESIDKGYAKQALDALIKETKLYANK